MFKIEEISGSLIRSGRFKEAIPVFHDEIQSALRHGVITEWEMRDLHIRFSNILLNPICLDDVAKLANMMTSLAVRIPGKIDLVDIKEFNKNVKESREA